MTRDLTYIILAILILAYIFMALGHKEPQPDHVARPQIKRLMQHHGITVMQIDHNDKAYFYRNGKKCFVNLRREEP